MEPVVAAAASETGYGLSGVRLPPAVLSRVGFVAEAPRDLKSPTRERCTYTHGDVAVVATLIEGRTTSPQSCWYLLTRLETC